MSLHNHYLKQIVMVWTSYENLYNVLNHSRVINWRLDQIVLIRGRSQGEMGGLLIFGEGIMQRHAESPDFRFPKVWVQEQQKANSLFSYPEGERT